MDACKSTKVEWEQQENGWVRDEKGFIVAVPVEWFRKSQDQMIKNEIELVNTPLTTAVSVIMQEMKKDKSEGSYYYSWQANIAMAIVDNIEGVSHEDANKAAKEFLDLFIRY